jgi:hypothetical protein
VLIQQIIGAAGAVLLQNAFRLGAAKPFPVGIGLLRGLLTLGAFFKSL